MFNRQKKILTYMMLNKPVPFEYIYSNENNEIELVFYQGNKSKLSVPNKHKGVPIKTIGSSCYCLNENLVDVTIAEGIEVIE